MVSQSNIRKLISFERSTLINSSGVYTEVCHPAFFVVEVEGKLPTQGSAFTPKLFLH